MASFNQVIDRAIEVAVQRAMLAVRPVGSYFYTESTEHPSVTFPNTEWEYLGGKVFSCC